MRVCVYAASSPGADPAYVDAARSAGRHLAAAGVSILYGGGAAGCMGAVADGALEAGGEVVGVIPRFMVDLEWGHHRLTKLEIVESLSERTQRLLSGSDAVFALPGGCGTLHELLEAITFKRLGLYFNPIVMLNTRGFYTPFVRFLEHIVDERFMNPEHRGMWSLAEKPEDVLPCIRSTPPWPRDARQFAVVRP